MKLNLIALSLRKKAMLAFATDSVFNLAGNGHVDQGRCPDIDLS
jgi:hypothetical protein